MSKHIGYLGIHWMGPKLIIIDLLRNIQKLKKCIKVNCNGRTEHISLKGILKLFCDVLFAPKDIINIISLSRFQEKLPVEYDSEEGNAFIVKTPTFNRTFEGTD